MSGRSTRICWVANCAKLTYELGANCENTEKEWEEYKKMQGQELPALADTICLNDGYGDFEFENCTSDLLWTPIDWPS